MRFEEFAAGYPREHGKSWYSDPGRDAITRVAAEWAHRFGEHLHDFLSGHGPLSTFEASRELSAYSRWNREKFVPTVRAIQVVGGGSRGVRAMHFHTLAHCLLPLWRPVLGAGGTANVRERRVAQLLLAIHASHMILRRQANLGGEAAVHPEATAVLAVQHGMLTETDALVTLLEIIRHRKDLIALPAPPQFESAVAGRNADLLLLDLRARTIAGIQVKTSLVREVAIAHRDGPVVLIDGAVDLGNQRLASAHQRSSTRRLTAWPGLISAHFVLGANLRSPVFAAHASAVVQLQAGLPATVYGTSNYLTRAAAHLRERVLSAVGAE